MQVAERTRERAKFYIGSAIAAVGIIVTVIGVVVTTSALAAAQSGANLAVATGVVEGVGFTEPVTFDAEEQAYAVRLIVPISGSAATEREARTLTCEVMDSERRVTQLTGADENVQTLVNGAYTLGRVDLPAGPASVQCGWAAPTDADSGRAIEREFEVAPAPAPILSTGPAIAFTGFVALLAGGLVVAIGWKRFRATR